MSKKSGLNSQTNLLRQNGVPALGDTEVKLNNSQRAFNPIGFYRPDKQAYIRLWTNYDLNQYCSIREWENLPNGLTSWNINRMKYFRGTLAGFEFGGNIYILPYVITGEINPYGLPTKIKPITFNGAPVDDNPDFFATDFELSVDFSGNELKDAKNKAILLYDSIPYSPTTNSPSRYLLNQIIINEIADALARININIVVSNKKMFFVAKDAKQADVIREELSTSFSSESPFEVIHSPLEVQTVQSSDDFNADNLFNTVKNWDAIRCFMNGISSKNFGTEKKERLVSGELAGNEEEVGLISDMTDELCRLFCNQMNAAFGTNISFKNKRNDYKAEENGNGNTKLEEENAL